MVAMGDWRGIVLDGIIGVLQTVPNAFICVTVCCRAIALHGIVLYCMVLYCDVFEYKY